MKRGLFAVGITWLMILSLGFPPAVWGCWHRPKEVTMVPSVSTNDRIVELKLTGQRFSKALQAALVKEGEPEIAAAEVQVLSKTEAICKFDLQGKAVGTWDLKLTNGYKFLFFKIQRPLVIEKGFVIEYPAPSLSGIEPSQYESGAVAEAAVSGAGFRPGISARLENGSTVIRGEISGTIAVNRFDCRFNLENAAAGQYDLIVANDDGKTSVLTSAVTVNPPPPEPAAPEAAEPAGQENEVPAIPSSLRPVFFDFDRSGLRADQEPALAENVSAINASGLYVTLGGHADERGPKAYNQALSARRVEAVRQYLLKQGIAPDRITVHAYGEEHPARTGHDEEAWAYNRRVDLLLGEGPLAKMELLEKINP